MRRVGDKSVTSSNVEELMRLALDETRATYPHPNPRVGAVLISPEGMIVAVEAHKARGEEHAEVLALGAADVTIGYTLFTTLEPCNHHGTTPPCTEAIIDAGIVKVIVGVEDPDEKVSGSGVDVLRDAGIEVVVGVIKDEIIANDPGYFHHRTTGRPLITLKLAATLDGQVAAVDGSSKWISSPEAREDAHRLRSANDVVVVGSGTVIADDPALDVRLDSFDGPQPHPVIIAGLRSVPADSAIYDRDPIVYHPQEGELVDPADVVTDLGRRGFMSVLVEGGPSVAGSFLRAGLVDQIVWYLAAQLGGGVGISAIGGMFESMDDIVGLQFAGVERIGPDVKISATVNKEQ